MYQQVETVPVPKDGETVLDEELLFYYLCQNNQKADERNYRQYLEQYQEKWVITSTSTEATE